MEDVVFSLARYAVPGLGIAILAFCAVWLYRRRADSPPAASLLDLTTGDSRPLPHWENAVGRHPRCDIVLGYATVSRFHAVISCRKGGWVLTDTGSRGGTLVNGDILIKSRPLQNGDALTFGSVTFRFITV
ncbi:MAG: FHA domain-containing protein [Oscillospiraceae bacterium]|nr:FHA domain-containing protein [Oscillospiraceae bacterium]